MGFYFFSLTNKNKKVAYRGIHTTPVYLNKDGTYSLLSDFRKLEENLLASAVTLPMFTKGNFLMHSCKSLLTIVLFYNFLASLVLNNFPQFINCHQFARVYDTRGSCHIQFMDPFDDGNFKSRYKDNALPSDHAFVCDSALVNVSIFLTQNLSS